MSKLRRKWLRTIESEESGQPIDDATRALLLETHPDLPILGLQQQGSAPAAQMVQPSPAQMMHPTQPEPEAEGPQDMSHLHQQNDDMSLLHEPPPDRHTDPQLQALQAQMQPQIDLPPQIDPQFSIPHQQHLDQQHLDQQHLDQQHLDAQLEQQLQHELASVEPSHA